MPPKKKMNQNQIASKIEQTESANLGQTYAAGTIGAYFYSFYPDSPHYVIIIF